MANESLPEVIAEMRERAEAMEIHGTTRGVKRTVLEFAARIEAAAKRAEDTPGNAAALRGALELCYRIIHCAMATGLINHDDADKAMDVYHFALSAPPRNCDMFATGEDALKAWQAYQRKHMEFDERWRTWDCIGWLYALAKTEGGAA